MEISDTISGEYIFPIDEVGGDNGVVGYCRRSFDIECALDYINEVGELALQLEHYCFGVSNEGSFDSYYDLVQVVKIGDPTETECPEPSSMMRSESSPSTPAGVVSINPTGLGADINRDGVVDEDDATYFAAHWTAESRMADMNNDKIIDSADVTAFAAAYGS